MPHRPQERAVRRALVVARDPWLRRALRRAVISIFGCPVVGTASVSSQRRSYDLVVLDLDLHSADTFDLIRQVIAKRPRPVTLVISNAPPRAAFELGRLGVEAFLQKPFEMGDLRAALGTATRASVPSVELLGRSWVGRVELRAAQGDLKRGMLDQALQLSHGNYTRAAQILAVSRQALQRAVRSRSTTHAGQQHAGQQEERA